MNGWQRAAGLSLALAISGCIVPAHSDFSTPLDTTLTFQSAFARDDALDEYRCLSRRLRAQYDADAQIYATLRGRMFAPLGSLGRSVLARNRLDDNLIGEDVHEPTAQLTFSLLGNRFSLDLRSEPAVEVQPNGGPAFLAAIIGAEFRDAELALLLEASADEIQPIKQLGIAWVEYRRAWKIDGLVQAVPEWDPDRPRRSYPSTHEAVTRLGPVQAMVVDGRFGTSQLTLTLPWNTEQRAALAIDQMPRIGASLRWETASR